MTPATLTPATPTPATLTPGTLIPAKLALGLSLLIGAFLGSLAIPAGAQVNHDVFVDEYGRFSPMWTYIDDGDTVTWHFNDRYDSIARRTPLGPWPAICSAVLPYDETDPNEFTGPMPQGASGVFVMGPKDAAAQPETWSSESIRGVFIRLGWSAVDGGPDWATRADWTAGQRYDWSVLDVEMEQAVANGKTFSIGVKAGRYKTPDWIFQTDIDGTDRGATGGGVTRVLVTHDRYSDPTTVPVTCGPTISLGNPGEQAYQDHYNNMLTELGEHIRSNNAWYRHLTYIKLSGANSDTHENKLPKECYSGCICNPEEWSLANYTPSGLYDFYLEQAQTVTDAFPGKSISYMLIQDGFPLVNEDGDYEGVAGPVDANADGLAVLPSGIQQTWTAIRQLQDAHQELLAVAHNGLSGGPDSTYLATNSAPAIMGQCRYDGVHPVGGPAYDQAGSGCPNPWVLRSGFRTRDKAQPWDSLTGFQTINSAKGVNDGPSLEAAFQNAMDSTDGVFLEIYEGLFLDIEQNYGGVLDALASGWTMAEWNEEFDLRRRNEWTNADLPDPYPLTHSHTFTRTLAGPIGNEIYHYIHATKCGIDDPNNLGTEYQYGAIVIQP